MPFPVWIALTAKKVVPTVAQTLVGSFKNRPQRNEAHKALEERLQRLENKMDSIDRRLSRVEGSLGIHLPENS